MGFPFSFVHYPLLMCHFAALTYKLPTRLQFLHSPFHILLLIGQHFERKKLLNRPLVILICFLGTQYWFFMMISIFDVFPVFSPLFFLCVRVLPIFVYDLGASLTAASLRKLGVGYQIRRRLSTLGGDLLALDSKHRPQQTRKGMRFAFVFFVCLVHRIRNRKIFLMKSVGLRGHLVHLSFSLSLSLSLSLSSPSLSLFPSLPRSLSLSLSLSSSLPLFLFLSLSLSLSLSLFLPPFFSLSFFLSFFLFFFFFFLSFFLFFFFFLLSFFLALSLSLSLLSLSLSRALSLSLFLSSLLQLFLAPNCTWEAYDIRLKYSVFDFSVDAAEVNGCYTMLKAVVFFWCPAWFFFGCPTSHFFWCFACQFHWSCMSICNHLKAVFLFDVTHVNLSQFDSKKMQCTAVLHFCLKLNSVGSLEP